MNRPDHQRPSDREAIEAMAAAWLAERDDGLSPEKAAEFARWRAADPRHDAAVARLENTWAALQPLRDFRPEARRHPDRDLLACPRASRRVVRFPRAVATALAASLVLAAVWWFARDHGAGFEAPQRYATTVDGYERVTLEDGSLLELNANSEVSVRFLSQERRVRLVRGEAHFMVAKNPARPFWVDAGTVAVRAVGTAFNVRLGASDVDVLVTEGRVEVNKNAGWSRGERDTRDGPPAGGGPTPLGANEHAVIPLITEAAAVAPAIEKLTPDAVRAALVWQGPRLVFVDTPLADAIAQFNRRNTVQLELADAELAALPIGGSFRAENVDAFVRLLTSGGDIVVERREPARLVLRKQK